MDTVQIGQIRQGDVFLYPVDDNHAPQGDPKQQVILAEGEMTGHAHRLAAPEVYDWTENGQRYIRVSGGIGTIQHEEHDPAPAAVIAPDVTYRVIPQRQLNLKDEWERVVD